MTIVVRWTFCNKRLKKNPTRRLTQTRLYGTVWSASQNDRSCKDSKSKFNRNNHQPKGENICKLRTDTCLYKYLFDHVLYLPKNNWLRLRYSVPLILLSDLNLLRHYQLCYFLRDPFGKDRSILSNMFQWSSKHFTINASRWKIMLR